MNGRDVMIRDGVSLHPDTSIADAARFMLEKRISGLPVLDSGGKLIGIITEGDFLRRVGTDTERKRPRWLQLLVGGEKLAEEYVHAHGRKVSEVMTQSPVVHLWGSYMAARQDEAMVVAAENAPGVRAVRSHLCWVDPVSGLTVYNPDEEKERKAEGP